MSYWVIKITKTEESRKGWCYHHVGDTWYHAGGSGHAAFAGVYEERQVKSILGQYKNRPHLKAEPVEVFFEDKT